MKYLCESVKTGLLNTTAVHIIIFLVAHHRCLKWCADIVFRIDFPIPLSPPLQGFAPQILNPPPPPPPQFGVSVFPHLSKILE